MAAIEDESSAWYKIKPVPRMVQNQLNHLLEIQMIELDKKILTTIHKAMQDRQRHTWVVTTLTTFLLLHIRELDAGRNIYWKRYEDIVCENDLMNEWQFTNLCSVDSGYTLRNRLLLLTKRSHPAIPCCGITTFPSGRRRSP